MNDTGENSGAAIAARYHADLARLPGPLRALIEQEAAAGNSIISVSSTFPAPPAGLCVMLAHPVSTRPRASDPDVRFYARNSSLYLGEWHDPTRFYFVIEAPLPPPPEPDMDAIRASLDAQARRASGYPGRTETFSERVSGSRDDGAAAGTTSGDVDSPLRRFTDSMRIDYEKWHDGIGFDLDAIDAASESERGDIERLLLSRGTSGWREVESLARLGTPGAIEALKRAFARGNAEVRAAVVRHAPTLVSDEARTESLIRGLRDGAVFEGLTQMLNQAADYHPPAVVDVLFRESLKGPGEKAVHFAALLYYIHGHASSRFDWALRPFFLRFHTDDPTERAAVFQEMCESLGVDGSRYR